MEMRKMLMAIMMRVMLMTSMVMVGIDGDNRLHLSLPSIRGWSLHLQH